LSHIFVIGVRYNQISGVSGSHSDLQSFKDRPYIVFSVTVTSETELVLGDYVCEVWIVIFQDVWSANDEWKGWV
jgi:hypothetical protein